MSTRSEVLLWAKRICAKRSAEPHVMLEISADASLEVAQTAFHGIARTAHPDLHRTTCTPDELELVTTAFALVAASYQQFRAQRLTTTKMAAIPSSMLPPRTKTKQPGLPGVQPIPAAADAAPVLVPEAAPAVGAPTQQMSARAVVHYRKAELSLRRGDVPAGILHMKMAIAADPASKFLRQALAQVEAELAKKR
jgi:hypothetical protein